MKKIIFIQISFLISLAAFAQPLFNMRYGSGYMDQAKKVIQTHDRNYIVVGQTDGFGSGGNAFMMKVDTLGTLLWMKDYEGINSDIIWDIIELPDNNLIFCGTTNSFGAGSLDAFITKSDSNGNAIWSKVYGTISGEYFFKIRPDEGNGFYVAGYAQKNFTEGSDILKIDSVGNVIWSKWVPAWSHQGEWYPTDMTPVASGGVILGGVGTVGLACWKFSATGNLIWSKDYKCNLMGGQGVYILENANGTITLNSDMIDSLTVAQSIDIGIINLDANGNVLWAKSYGGTYFDKDRSISASRDTGIIICGQTNSAGNGTYDACLIKIKLDGSVQWAKAYGTVWVENTATAEQTDDGGYILCGYTYSVGTNLDSVKVHLVKTDSLGTSSCNDVSWYPAIANHSVVVTTTAAPQNIVLITDEFTWPVVNQSFYQRDICDLSSIVSNDVAGNYISLFPNPATDELRIENLELKITEIEIYSYLGEKVFYQPNTSNSQHVTISIADFPPGIYFITVTDQAGNKLTKKVVKM